LVGDTSDECAKGGGLQTAAWHVRKETRSGRIEPGVGRSFDGREQTFEVTAMLAGFVQERPDQAVVRIWLRSRGLITASDPRVEKLEYLVPQ